MCRLQCAQYNAWFRYVERLATAGGNDALVELTHCSDASILSERRKATAAHAKGKVVVGAFDTPECVRATTLRHVSKTTKLNDLQCPTAKGIEAGKHNMRSLLAMHAARYVEERIMYMVETVVGGDFQFGPNVGTQIIRGIWFGLRSADAHLIVFPRARPRHASP